MLVVRSLLFNVAFYINLIAFLLMAVPTFLLPRRVLLSLAQTWARTNTWLLRVVTDTEVEIIGAEKIPPGGLLVAAKHQSMWETFALLPMFADPAYILKRELQWIPLFGWCCWKSEMIPIDRGARSAALAHLVENVKRELARGRQILIFPEGTRRPPGAEPAYKFGVAKLYAETGATCLPVALNSGLFWPRRKMLRYPGTIRLEVLDPIPPGLDAKEFFTRLQDTIETASARLVEQGRTEITAKLGAPPPIETRTHTEGA